MESEQANTTQYFQYQGERLPIRLVNTQEVFPGVMCRAYEIVGDPDRDLALILIKPGAKTMKQEVLEGEVTIEGFLIGAGELEIHRKDGKIEKYEINFETFLPFEIHVYIGDTMQWKASEHTGLLIYEICCNPPFQEGRFLNIE